MRGLSPSSVAKILGAERSHADRDKYTGDLEAEFGDVASPRLSRKPDRVLLVHACEVLGIG